MILIQRCSFVSTEKDGMSHLMTNHWLQRGVLVLQCGGVRAGPLRHHLLIVVVHRQPLRHLLYVLPQRGDRLPDEQQDYQPAQYWLAESWQEDSDSQGKQPEDPDTELSSQKVPGTGPPTRAWSGLREEFTVSWDQVTVAVDHLTAVIHRPTQTTSLQQPTDRTSLWY